MHGHGIKMKLTLYDQFQAYLPYIPGENKTATVTLPSTVRNTYELPTKQFYSLAGVAFTR